MSEEIFGNSEEWAEFQKKFSRFVENYGVLQSIIARAFNRRGEGENKVDRMIFGLGRVCSEDFQQAVILCANGFGIGALQIVRGMYERQVTAAYLAKYPGEIDDFIDYLAVHRRKGMVHLKAMYGSKLSEIIPKQEQEQFEQNFQKVKDRFTEVLCRTCNTSRPMMSWSKLGMVSMAQKANSQLAEMYYQFYYRPTLFSHSTVSSVLARLALQEDGTMAFDSEEQGLVVGEALVFLHALMFIVLKFHNNYFNLGLENDLKLQRSALIRSSKQAYPDFTY
jgi:uncharacterized protein DUF5677